MNDNMNGFINALKNDAGQGELSDASLDGVSGGVVAVQTIAIPPELLYKLEDPSATTPDAANGYVLAGDAGAGNFADEEVTIAFPNRVRGSGQFGQ